MLTINALMELEDRLREELEDNLTGILTNLNRQGKIEDLLSLLSLSRLLDSSTDIDGTFLKNGRIVVLGASEVPERHLLGVAKSLGLEKERFEFYLDYDDGKKFEYSKLYYHSNYSLVMVGPMPHSSTGKGDYSSAIAAMEATEGYPPVIRIETSGLKAISKSAFRMKLQEALEQGKITA